MELLLLKYGYLLLFAGVVLEGEAFLIVGAFLANRGYFNVSTVALVALAANTLSAQLYYTAARVRGRAWFEQRFAETAVYRKVLYWVGRHDNWLLLLSRYLFGFRIVIPAACGAFGMPPSRFMVLNVLAGILWVVPTVLAGYYFGERVDAFVRGAQHYVLAAVLIAVLVGVAALVAWRHIRTFRRIFQNLEWSDLHNLVPFLMGLIGALNILAAIMPRSENVLRSIRDWLPLELSEGSRMLMLFTGVALLQITRDLARRKELAWWVAVIALSATLVLHVMSGFDVQNSLVASFLLVYLWFFRRRFYTRSDPASLRKGLMMTPLLLLMIFFYGVTGLAATQSQFSWTETSNPVGEAFRDGILILEPEVIPKTRYARLFLVSLQVAGWIARLYILILILRPFISRDRLEAPREEIQRIFSRFGKDSVAAFAIQEDKHHLLVANRQGLVAYATKGNIALACGDPMAPEELFETAVEDYRRHCQRHGWTACIHLAADERVKTYHALKLHSLHVTDEAIIDLQSLPDVNLQTLQRYDRTHQADPLIDEQLEEVTEDWLESRHMREMGFSAGRFSLEHLSRAIVFILGDRQHVDAFSAWLPYPLGRGVVLDVIRQRRQTSPETVRTFFKASLTLLKKLLFEKAAVSAGLIDRAQIDSFNPKWEARYLIHPRGANVEKIMRAIKRF